LHQNRRSVFGSEKLFGFGDLSVLIKSKKADALMVVGLFFLAFGNVWQWSLHRHPLFTESVTDFSSGLFMGVAIGTLLLSIFIRSRARHRDN